MGYSYSIYKKKFMLKGLFFKKKKKQGHIYIIALAHSLPKEWEGHMEKPYFMLC